MVEFLLTRVSVWLACIAWFAGAFFRLLPANAERESQASKANAVALYGWSWLTGACLLLIHIVASYGFVYHWSHNAAIEETANDSFRTTGIRAGWGVYVNFLFAATWFCYSVEVLSHGVRNRIADKSIYAFTAVILASATVLFEAGVIRYLAVLGFVALIGMHIGKRTL